MKGYQTFKIPVNYVVLVESYAFPKLEEGIQQAVDKIYQTEEKRRHLFPGKILHCLSLDRNTLTGAFVDYKYYLAQYRDPSLRKYLPIQPVSINGMTLSGDKILVGQRGADVTQYPHFFEFVPSGGIDPTSLVGDRVDLKKQTLIELEEEAGFTEAEVRPFLLAHNPSESSYEICVEVVVHSTELKPSSKEYQQLFWLSRQELSTFLEQQGHAFVPFSLWLAHHTLGHKNY